MRWPPYKHVIFDCDSTLTSIEGIDALASQLGKAWRVSVLTEAAMSGDVELEDVYAKRLRTLKPTRRQVQAIKQLYKQNAVTDAKSVISALLSLGHEVYIISGGLAEPVIEFGTYLGVPRQNIRAVSLEYDQLKGSWWQQIEDQPNEAERYLTHADEALTISDGKAIIIKELLKQRTGRSVLVGDGVSDLLAGQAVDLFVGFGGVARRKKVAHEAPVFITSESLSPLLALAAGPAGLKQLSATSDHALAERAVKLINNGAMRFQSEQIESKFQEAWQFTYKTIYSGTNRSST